MASPSDILHNTVENIKAFKCSLGFYAAVPIYFLWVFGFVCYMVKLYEIYD